MPPVWVWSVCFLYCQHRFVLKSTWSQKCLQWNLLIRTLDKWHLHITDIKLWSQNVLHSNLLFRHLKGPDTSVFRNQDVQPLMVPVHHSLLKLPAFSGQCWIIINSLLQWRIEWYTHGTSSAHPAPLNLNGPNHWLLEKTYFLLSYYNIRHMKYIFYHYVEQLKRPPKSNDMIA